jgi:hypothetical protein
MQRQGNMDARVKPGHNESESETVGGEAVAIRQNRTT